MQLLSRQYTSSNQVHIGVRMSDYTHDNEHSTKAPCTIQQTSQVTKSKLYGASIASGFLCLVDKLVAAHECLNDGHGEAYVTQFEYHIYQFMQSYM